MGLVRRMLPRGLKLWAFERVVRSPVLSRCYYLFSGAFSREYAAVLYGRLQHVREAEAKSDDGARYTLRRNTHRLEKGLIMRPRREVFATGYLGETVNIFCALADQDDGSATAKALLDWSGDVLYRYFEAVPENADGKVDRLRVKFTESFEKHARQPGQCAPFVRDQTPLRVTIDDMIELARRRRSVRWYLQQPVPREIIDKAMLVGGYSPSACNRQPFEFRVFDRPERAAEIGAIAMGTAGFAQNFPCLVVIVGQLRAFPFDRDRHVPYIDGSLAAMAFQFALEVQGVSSCCINWPDIPEREAAMAKALDLEPDQRVVMLMSVGFPDPEGSVPYSQKKTVDELRSYDPS
ncbi:nitroreductase family protein [Mucisphaera calidilacus]|uniref:nitroreductase family protein n=1 Tax=Mucisphaera calidilacus TaxID=2527982 RepID=UPI001F199B32|nr:nitroreductase family protein [Mucisphaera calidilacus]